jgi:uncharacterized RDD family membrane protein YckC
MNQLREHYERQDTEELLEIAKKDLTDEARVVLAEVLKARGVSAADAEAARAEGLAENEKALAAESLLASRWSRLFAFAIDVWGVVLLLFILLSPLILVSPVLHESAVIVVWLVYFVFRDSIPGQSIGKRMLGLRAVQIESGKSCTWSMSLGRNVTHLFFVLDALFVLGQRRMRLGDMMAGTVVRKLGG